MLIIKINNYIQSNHMVIKKSFALLVASGTTRFFAFVSIISVNGCRNDAEYFYSAY